MIFLYMTKGQGTSGVGTFYLCIPVVAMGADRNKLMGESTVAVIGILASLI